MTIDNATLEGLQMIKDRYWFGMFTSSMQLTEEEEIEEYKMRDALFEIIRQFELDSPSIFDYDQEL